MKKIQIAALALTATLCLTGCKGGKTPQETVPSPTAPPVTVSPTEPTTGADVTPVYENMNSISLPITVEKEYSEDNTLIFSYSYQTIYPELQDREVSKKIGMNFADRIEKTRFDAQEVLSQAKAQYKPGSAFTPLNYEIQYDITRIDQGVLSMFGHILQTSDAAGSNRNLIAANYDLVTGDVLTVGSILYHIDTKDDLAQLVIENLENRDDITLFKEFRDAVNSRFERDESQDEDFYFSENGLCFYFAPYEIAPRSSGTVIAEIPYNKLTGIIGEAYFPAERTYTSGAVSISPFQEDVWESYEQFVDVIAQPDSKKILLTTDSAVQDIRIYQLILPENDILHTEQKNIYATNFLPKETAIVLEADFNPSEPNYLIRYSMNGVQQSYYFTADSQSGDITLTAK